MMRRARAGWCIGAWALVVGRLTGLFVVLVSPIFSEPAAGDSVGMRPAGGVTERVALLHGLGRRANSLFLLEWRLEARGFEVCNID